MRIRTPSVRIRTHWAKNDVVFWIFEIKKVCSTKQKTKRKSPTRNFRFFIKKRSFENYFTCRGSDFIWNGNGWGRKKTGFKKNSKNFVVSEKYSTFALAFLENAIGM